MSRSLLDATDDEVLQALFRYNWPAGAGKPYSPQHESNYRRGLNEAKNILGESDVPSPTTARLFGPDIPDDIISQRNDWSCAVRSTYAALYALGQPVTYGDEGPNDVYEWLVPQYDNDEKGLLAGDGSGLVEALTAHGYSAGHLFPASLADVQARAGLQPVMIGGVNWGPAGHWVYVRGVESDGTLILENPAGTYMGIGDQLRDSFGRLGPFAMVWIDVPQAPPQPEPEPAPADDVAALKARVAELETILGYASQDIAAALRKASADARASLDALDAAIDTLERQHPAA